MTEAPRASVVEPAPTPEEAAAIAAALEALRDSSGAKPDASRGRSRWRLAGLLGHPPPGMDPDEPLWSYSHWEDMA